MKARILTIYETVRETEKAILISTMMEKDYALAGEKEFWMPKSQVKELEEGLAIADWLVHKCETFTNSTSITLAHLITNDDGSVKFFNV